MSPTSKPAVLFIDDEEWFAKNYMKELRAEFEVQYCDKVAGAEAEVRRLDRTYAAIILDIMMPATLDMPPEAVEDGLMTGVCLLARMKVPIERDRIAVLILTNRGEGAVRDAIRARRHEMPDTLYIEIHHKLQTPAFLLPKRLKDLIERVRDR